jgi:hypothetical protein
MKRTAPQVKYKPGSDALAAALNDKIAKLVREHPQDLNALKKAIDERNSLILL